MQEKEVLVRKGLRKEGSKTEVLGRKELVRRKGFRRGREGLMRGRLKKC